MEAREEKHDTGDEEEEPRKVELARHFGDGFALDGVEVEEEEEDYRCGSPRREIYPEAPAPGDVVCEDTSDL